MEVLGASMVLQSGEELDNTIGKELELLRGKLSQADMGGKKSKELMVRLMYCEMLGHSASFGHITALKMAQQGSLPLKRVGYLAAGLFLNPDHELLLLLVNTVQKDLKSTNILDNCMALTAVSSLFGPDMIPAVLHQVLDKMKDTSAMVRKKSVMTVYSFLVKAPHLVHHLTDKFKEALCDREPSVMGAALLIYSKLVTTNPSGHQSLVRPLISILTQVSSHTLPNAFEFHGVAAPWMQIQLLKMLSKLGHNNEYASNLMYDVLEQMMRRVSLKQQVSYAVHYECVSTIATIYPNKELTSLAAKSVSRFLKSRDNNLRYLGIEALGCLLVVDPGCGSSHQMILVECLTDPDLTLRTKTLELLCLMADSSNIEVISDKFLECLPPSQGVTLELLCLMADSSNIEVISDKFLECLPSLTDASNQRDLSQMLVRMASENYQSLGWFLRTICDLCLLADLEIDNLVATTIETITRARRTSGPGVSAITVETFLPYMSRILLNEPLVQLTIWVSGEFCSQDISPLMTQDAVQYLLDLCGSEDTEWPTVTKMYILSALWKIYSKSEELELNLQRSIEAMVDDTEPEVRQGAAELLYLSASTVQMKGGRRVLSDADTSGCDWTLSFLDQFVSDALAAGAAPYRPKQQRTTEGTLLQNENQLQTSSGLNFQPYTAPSLPSNKSSSNKGTNQDNGSSTPTNPGTSVASGDSSEHPTQQQIDSSQLQLSGVTRVWGQSGYTKPNTTEADKDSPGSPLDQVISPASHQATTLLPPESTRSSVATVELNTTTATRDEPVDRCNTESLEEEDPELKQKRNLAQALFGRQAPGGRTARDQSPDVPATPPGSCLVDLLSMGNETLEDQTSDPLGRIGSPNIDSVLQATHLPSQGLQSVHSDERESPPTEEHSTRSHPSIETHLDSSSVQQVKSSVESDSSLMLAQPSDQLDPLMAIASEGSICLSQLNEFVPAMLDDSIDQGGSTMEPSHQLPAEFHGFASSRQYELLCSDALVQLHLCRVWKPQELGLVFFVNNKSAEHDVTAVQLTASLPTSLRLENSDDRKYSESLHSVGPTGSVSLSMHCTCTTPSNNMLIGGEVAYRDCTQASRRLFFNIDVNLNDLLRPHHLTTPEFGRAWAQPCHDARFTINSARGNLQTEMLCLSENLQVAAVDISGDEALCATTVLQASSCLIHFKQENGKLNVWIKTNNNKLCDVIRNSISRILGQID